MVSALALAALVGCEDGNGAPDGAVLPGAPAGAEVVRSSRARITASAAPAEDLQALARGNAEFGLALYHAVGAEAAISSLSSSMKRSITSLRRAAIALAVAVCIPSLSFSSFL